MYWVKQKDKRSTKLPRQRLGEANHIKGAADMKSNDKTKKFTGHAEDPQERCELNRRLT